MTKVDEILINLIQQSRNISSICSLEYNDIVGKNTQKYIAQAKAQLWEEIDNVSPCASMKLKLNAKEKYIWLTAIQEYRERLSELFGEGK